MLMTASELICHGIYCSLPRGTVRGPADLFLFHPELVLNSKKKKKRRVVGTSQEHSALKLTLICACDGNQIHITQNTEPFFSF